MSWIRIRSLAAIAAIEPKVRVLDTFPADSHPPIVLPAAIVAASKRPAARAFLDFLRSPDGGAIFARHGFAVPQR